MARVRLTVEIPDAWANALEAAGLTLDPEDYEMGIGGVLRSRLETAGVDEAETDDPWAVASKIAVTIEGA